MFMSSAASPDSGVRSFKLPDSFYVPTAPVGADEIADNTTAGPPTKAWKAWPSPRMATRW